VTRHDQQVQAPRLEVAVVPRRRLAQLDVDERRLLLERAEEWGDEDDGRVVDRGDAKEPARGAGVERRLLEQQPPRVVDELAEGGRKLERAPRRIEPAARADEEGIAERRAQAAEQPARRGLGEPEARGRARDVTLLEQHVERQQQVQVRRPDMLGAHDGHHENALESD
jgi:hypothetical protein